MPDRPCPAATTTRRPGPVLIAAPCVQHDAQLDFYGRRLATCSSDRSVKVFDVVDGAPAGPGVTLVGHEGPVWQVAWAHPKFGSVLASASYDGKVLIWKHQDAPAAPTRAGGRYHNQPPSAAATATVTVAAGGSWQKIKEHAMHSASVNSLAWAPPELGAVLACASADGNVSVLTFNCTWCASARGVRMRVGWSTSPLLTARY